MATVKERMEAKKREMRLRKEMEAIVSSTVHYREYFGDHLGDEKKPPRTYYRIHYKREPDFRLDTESTMAPYKHLIHISAGSLEEVFHIMQGEIWSPQGEARDLIRALGLHHTSMSVGDVIYDTEAQKAYGVDRIGFKEMNQEKWS